MQEVKVGIEEFSKKLDSFIEARSRVAITRNGETLGFFVPAPRPLGPIKKLDIAKFEAAAAKLDASLAAAGVTGEELIEEYEREVRESRRNRGC